MPRRLLSSREVARIHDLLDAGITQAQVATDVGVTQQCVSYHRRRGRPGTRVDHRGVGLVPVMGAALLVATGYGIQRVREETGLNTTTIRRHFPGVYENRGVGKYRRTS